MPTTPSTARKPADRKPAAKKTAPAKPAPAEQPADHLAGDYVVETSKGTVTLTRYSQLPFGVTVEVHQLQKNMQAKLDELNDREADLVALLAEVDEEDEGDVAEAEAAQQRFDRDMADLKAEAAMVEFEVVMLQLLAGADDDNLAVLKKLPQSEVGRIYRAWQRHGQVDLPGILGLLTLLEDHQEAIEADLIRAGLRLRWLNDGVHDLDWRDLYVLVSQTGPGSSTYRSVYGDDSPWGLTEHLLAGLADDLRTLLWFQTEDGHKGRNRPRRIPRPGVEPEVETSTETFGKGAVSIEEFDAWLKGDFIELDPETYQPKAMPALEQAGELTREQRNQRILAELAAGRSRRELAEEFGLSPSTIGRIARSGLA